MITALFNVFTGNDTADENIYHVPLVDLSAYGLSQANLEAANDRVKEGEITYAIFKILISAITGTSYLSTASASNILGLIGTSVDSSIGLGIARRTFTFTATYLLNLATMLISPIPLNSNSDGKLFLSSVFPSITKVATGGNVTAGIGLSASILNSYGGRTYANVSVGSDCRQEIFALINALRNTLTVRNSTSSPAVTSAITTISRSDAGTVTAQTPNIPAAAYANTNPTTGILSSDVNKLMLLNYTTAFTIEKAEQADETIIVNVA